MNEIAPVNPFGQSDKNLPAQVETESSRAIAEVQAAMIIAKKFPRDQKQAMDRILDACTRPSLAETSLYSYARGGTEITGPSIRLAETIAQNWGNLQYGIRELDQKDGESIVETYAWDVETNTRQVKVFSVKHKRHTRKGSYKLEDPRDIYEMVANQGARRLRACILGVVPGDVVESAVDQCNLTLRTNFEVTPDKIKSLEEKFLEFKVTKEMIEKRIQRRLDAITPALMVSLGKIYNSLKDGMSAPKDWFEVTSPDVDNLNKKLAEKRESEKQNDATQDTKKEQKASGDDSGNDKDVSWPKWFSEEPYVDYVNGVDNCGSVELLQQFIEEQIKPARGTMTDARLQKLLKYAEFVMSGK